MSVPTTPQGWLDQAQLHLLMGEPRPGLEGFLRAREGFRIAWDNLQVARAAYGAGLACVALGRRRQAATLFEEASGGLIKFGGSVQEVVDSLVQEAELRLAEGSLLDARDLFLVALRRCDGPAMARPVRLRLVEVYLDLLDFDEAAPEATRLHETLEDDSSLDEQARVILAYGLVRANAESWGEASEALSDARDLFCLLGRPVDAARAARANAHALWRASQEDEALGLWRQAAAEARWALGRLAEPGASGTGDVREQTRCRELLGDILAGHDDEAALREYRAVERLHRESRDPWSAGWVQLHQARILHRLGRDREAASLAIPGLIAVDAAGYGMADDDAGRDFWVEEVGAFFDLTERIVTAVADVAFVQTVIDGARVHHSLIDGCMDVDQARTSAFIDLYLLDAAHAAERQHPDGA